MTTLPDDGRRRVVIEGVEPEIDAGRHPIKRTLGDVVTVRADAFADGHDRVACELLHRPPGSATWRSVDMRPLGNDRFEGTIRAEEKGEHLYTVRARVDRFATWRADLEKRVDAGQAVDQEMLVGAAMVESATERARAAGRSGDAERLEDFAARIGAAGSGRSAPEHGLEAALAPDLAELMAAHPDRTHATRYARELRVAVDRERAGFSAWYELFPRSCAAEPGRHGTLRDVEHRLPRIAELGFDVLYLPPIHPIGRTNRKGPENRAEARPGDPGSPWAIGSEEGGHKAVHPDLGTLEDFESLVGAARAHGMEVALDLAFQCSPDHPYVRDHPEWFRHRPDGSIRHAENPPKRYEDIVPFDFECDAWRSLWEELLSVVTFWIERGVRIFRVDNPHTKPFAFWEWLLGRVRDSDPEVLFLSEAFTRPKIMFRLAALGMTQSYTYFTWRNEKAELVEYFTELTTSPVSEYFRPNLWPNTPDILHEYLQSGGPPAFRVRALLAATLAANWGIFGPPFLRCENEAREPGSEEYQHSDKYEIRVRDDDDPHGIADLVARLNRIRREHRALRVDRSLAFHEVDDDHLIAYSKRAVDGSDRVLVVVNLDPFHPHEGFVDLDVGALGLEAGVDLRVEDLLTGGGFTWHGARNWVRIDPDVRPGHLFRLEA
jgi:starch synthase (maltosyl-transferring)